MNYLLGIAFALGAFLTWGIGDFLIQRTTRATDVWRALGYLGTVGAVVLLPWALPQLVAATAHPELLPLLGVTAALACVVAPLTFAAYRKGKLAVVSPLLALELPITVTLALQIGRERLSAAQLALVGLVAVGTILAAKRGAQSKHNLHFWEAGVLLALGAAVGQAATNFTIGKISQADSPILAVWIGHLAVAVECFLVITARRQLGQVRDDLRRFPTLIAAQGVTDVTAWVCYALATVFIPISIAVTVSESYVALAVLLGIVVNRERITRWQSVGIAFVILGIITLATVSG